MKERLWERRERSLERLQRQAEVWGQGGVQQSAQPVSIHTVSDHTTSFHSSIVNRN